MGPEPLKIKFYSANDMSIGWYLKAIDAFFQQWDEKIQNPDLSRILELYNIKQYFDHGVKFKNQTDERFEEYQSHCREIPKILGQYFSTINDGNILELRQTVVWNGIEDFWQLIDDYKVYQRLSSEALNRLLNTYDTDLWDILKHKSLVLAFGDLFAEYLASHSQTAEQLISYYLAKSSSGVSLYFPREFTQAMRDRVLNDYLAREDANLNYLQLLERAQSTKEFPISDKMKLKAKRKAEEMEQKLFSEQSGFAYGVEVSFESIPDGFTEETICKDEYKQVCTYSTEWISENQDYPTLLNNFISMFEFVDSCNRCTFVSLHAELGALESCLGVKGKNDYPIGIQFNIKHNRSKLQMLSYYQQLRRLNIEIEDIFQWFFRSYLQEEFGAEGFVYNPPSLGTTYLEKCRLLSGAIDGVLKQYRLYCEDGKIDRELLEISSGHIVFRDIPSVVENKYAYCNSDTLRTEMYYLFSDQSGLSYTKKTRGKYRNLFQLLSREQMKKEDFECFQQSDLDWLIERGSVLADDDGNLAINNIRLSVLMDLFYHEVVCPNYYRKALRLQVEQLVRAGEMCYENTLFSKPEQAYLNYILNKAEFSNGLDLRNKYSHCTYSLDEKEQAEDYMELLKIMSLIVIKINEEFCLQEQSNTL